MPRSSRLPRGLVRFVLASGLGLALWAIALPARASSAPFCDDRGATADAPAPVLVGSEGGAQLAAVKLSCEAEELFFGATLTRSHEAPAPTYDAPEPVLASVVPPVLPASSEALDRPPPVEHPTEGVRSRIERPPRG